MKRFTLFCFFVILPSFGQIQNGHQGFEPVSQKILSSTMVQQLGHLSPEWVQLGKLSKKEGELLRVTADPDFGTPRMVTGKLSLPSSDPAEVITLRFIKKNKALFGLNDLDEFKVASSHSDDLGHSHVTLHLFHKSLEVWPAEVKVHIDERGQIHAFNGVYRSPGSPDLSPGKSEKSLIPIALQYLNLDTTQAKIDRELLIYDFHIKEPVLAYHLHVQGTQNILINRDLFFDAHSGALLNDINRVCTTDLSKAGAVTATVYPTLDKSQTATVSAFDDVGTIYLINTSKQMFPGQLDPQTLAGTIYVIEANHTNQGQGLAFDPNGDRVFNDDTNTHAAGSAAHYISLTYDWMLSTLNRNSWDNNGSSFKVFVNFREDPSEGLDNAFWTGQELVFGDGGQNYRNLAFAQDVATHEVCHAITSSSAALVYQFQSGALNESFSDIYAATQDSGDWLLGEDVTISEVYGAPALRNMSNPNQGRQPGQNGWQPAHMNEFQNLQATQDSGGVHVNSGIPNHAYYKLATAIGRDKAIQIMHRTLTQYLTRNSEFVDFRSSAEKAAADLHGQGSAEQTAVSNACSEVGIGAAAQNPGTSANTLYMPFTAPFDYYGLSYANTFYISNTSDSNVSGSVFWYSADGTPSGASEFTAAPHTMLMGSSSDPSQWLKVESDGKLVGTYQHMTADGSSWSMIPATAYISNGLFIPHVATNTQKFWTIGALTNVRETPSSLVYVDNLDNAWTVDTNQVGESLAFDFEELYGTYPDVSSVGGLWGFFLNYDLNAGKVLEQNVTGAEIFGRKDANMAAGLIVDATSGRSILFTHVAADTNTFWTGYSVVNMTGETARVQINCYNNSGSLLASNVAEIAAFGKLLQVTGANSYVPTGTSWFIVSGLSETTVLSGMELFGSQDDRQLAGFQATPYVGKSFFFPFVISGTDNRPSNFQGLVPNWTGISVINPNEVAVTVNVKIYRSDGASVPGSFTIQPYNKLLGTIESLFGVTDFVGYAAIESSLPVAGFSLSGFSDQREMAANPMVFTE